VARYKVGLATRRRILEATRLVLGERGLDGTTLKAICQRADIGAGSFYNLFGSKEAAILQVVREAIRAVDPDPAGSGEDSIADLSAAFVKFVTGDPELARIYVQIAVSGGLTDDRLRERVLAHHERRVYRFTDALQRERPDLAPGEARVEAQRLIAALTGLVLYWLLDPSQPFEELAEGLVERLRPDRA